MPSFRGGRGGAGVLTPGVLSSVWTTRGRRMVCCSVVRSSRRKMIIVFLMLFIVGLVCNHRTTSPSLESSTHLLRATTATTSAASVQKYNDDGVRRSSVCLSSPERNKWRKDLDQYFKKEQSTAAADEKEEGKTTMPIYAITLTVNSGYFDFFINWHYYYIKHTTSPYNNNNLLIVIAEDSLIYTKLKAMFDDNDDSMTSNTIVLPGYATTTTTNNHSSMMHNSNAEDYDSVNYKSLVSTRATHLLNLICSLDDTTTTATTTATRTTNDKKDVVIIYSDVDTVLVKDPFPYIHNMLSSSSSSSSSNTQYDILAAIDDHNYGGVSDYYCTGFIVIAQTYASISFLVQWEQELISKPQLNQPIFNTILRSTKIPIRHGGLDENKFAPGRLYFNVWVNEGETGEKTKKEKTIFVHNNYIVGHDAKRKRFEENGLWVNEYSE